jgi:hypothetical protein
VCDEAPAATHGGVNEVGCDRPETGSALWAGPELSGSDQLRCCGNPSWI